MAFLDQHEWNDRSLRAALLACQTLDKAATMYENGANQASLAVFREAVEQARTALAND